MSAEHTKTAIFLGFILLVGVTVTALYVHERLDASSKKDATNQNARHVGDSWPFPGADAQCIIRRNLAEMEMRWNVSESESFALPDVATGNMTGLRPALRYDSNTSKMVIDNDDMDTWANYTLPLHMYFDCVDPETGVRPPNLKLTFGNISHDNTTGVSLPKRVRLTITAPFPATDSAVTRCEIRPVLSPLYMFAYAEWVSARGHFAGSNSNRFYKNAYFPWIPCRDGESGYTDNVVEIVGAPIAVVSVDPDTSTHQLGLGRFGGGIPFRLPTTVTAAASTAQQQQQQQQKRLYTGLCEDALGRDDLDDLKHVLENRYIFWDTENKQSNIARPQLDRLSWVNARESGYDVFEEGSVHMDDTCAIEQSRRVLRIHEATTDASADIAFTESAISPTIGNPYATEIPQHVQCYPDIVSYITRRLAPLKMQRQVTYTHPCFRGGTPVGDTQYAWRANNVFDETRDPEGECTHRGFVTHTWRAVACGQSTTATFITRVEDTTGPVMDRTLLPPSHGGGPVKIERCWWPLSDASRVAHSNGAGQICLNSKIAADVRMRYTDNCFGSSELKIYPQWNRARWRSCSTTSLRAIARGNTNIREPACVDVDINAVAPGFVSYSRDPSTDQDNACIKTNAFDFSTHVIQVHVPVLAADPCRNFISASEPELIYQLTFVDPMKAYHDTLTKLVCPR